jgi:hypothetical protein
MKILYLKASQELALIRCISFNFEQLLLLSIFLKNGALLIVCLIKKRDKWDRIIFDRFYCFQLALKLYTARDHFTP